MHLGLWISQRHEPFRCIRCVINGNDTRFTERSTDIKLFPLSYNSQITKTLGTSQHEMIFNQKPRKPIILTANASKKHKSAD